MYSLTTRSTNLSVNEVSVKLTAMFIQCKNLLYTFPFEIERPSKEWWWCKMYTLSSHSVNTHGSPWGQLWRTQAYQRWSVLLSQTENWMKSICSLSLFFSVVLRSANILYYTGTQTPLFIQDGSLADTFLQSYNGKSPFGHLMGHSPCNVF